MQSSKLNSVGIPSTNYGMAVIERKIFANSRISTFLVNKQPSKLDGQQTDDFNRVAGVELKLLSRDTKFSSDIYFNSSFDKINLIIPGRIVIKNLIILCFLLTNQIVYLLYNATKGEVMMGGIEFIILFVILTATIG